jgi:transcriptional regulator
MYLPRFNAMPGDDVRRFLAAHPAAHLVTVGPDGRPDSTLLPIIVEQDGDEEPGADPGEDETGTPGPGGAVRVLGHLARSNAHWQRIDAGSPALVVVTGADAYVSPGWYATKREHGRVVPTWNYTEVHLTGRVTVHDDPDWVLDVVTRLTRRHESHREQPWAVTDAPEKWLRGRLRAIVGVEVVVERVEGKAKLSQNRSDADRSGAIAGLREEPSPVAHAVATDMAVALGSR